MSQAFAGDVSCSLCSLLKVANAASRGAAGVQCTFKDEPYVHTPSKEGA